MRCAKLSLFLYLYVCLAVMKSDIVIVGGGASGLMAAYYAASAVVGSGSDAMVTVLEKMPRPARKVMITGKGRCNITNLKDWNDFSPHVRVNSGSLRPAFHNLTPEALLKFFEEFGMKTVLERGDRVYPQSGRSMDVVDTLLLACNSVGVKIVCDAEVADVEKLPDGFALNLADGRKWSCRKLIIATGGLSYPATGSTGDGYRWAAGLGHRIVPCFPSLTALVPAGYKRGDYGESGSGLPRHVERALPLTELGAKLCGVQLKNVSVRLEIDGRISDEEFGDVDFTDGGIEGPLGFQLSRKAVKALINNASVELVIDLKPAVDLAELTGRVEFLRNQVQSDPRSRNIREKEKLRILLGKLMPWDLIPGFRIMHPDLLTFTPGFRRSSEAKLNVEKCARALKNWRFPLVGYVGYERCVVTAGGVAMDEVVPKNMESRKCPGLYLCGEVLDIDSDTGGYNLHTAFCTGALAGMNAAKSLASRGSGERTGL